MVVSTTAVFSTALECMSPRVSAIALNKDFTGGPVIENPPFNAGDTGSIPGQGTKIPHAMGQPSPCSATREACTPQ